MVFAWLQNCSSLWTPWEDSDTCLNWLPCGVVFQLKPRCLARFTPPPDASLPRLGCSEARRAAREFRSRSAWTDSARSASELGGEMRPMPEWIPIP